MAPLDGPRQLVSRGAAWLSRGACRIPSNSDDFGRAAGIERPRAIYVDMLCCAAVMSPNYHISRRYDLHTHSLRSDGALTPTELVMRAHRQGVAVLALTDHDVTDGIAEAQAAASQCPLTLVPGVEISVTRQAQTLHIVGLGIDTKSAPLQVGLARLREFRTWRAQEIGRRLAKENIFGGYEGAVRVAKGSVLSRTHFARFLVEQRHVRDMGQAFKRYLGKAKAGYVPGRWAALSEAVDWIRGAGGQAVIAHPARYKLSKRRLRQLFGEFKECGGVAIEVVSGCHSAEENRRLGAIARELDLLASVGSDYHGPDKPWVELGQGPPLPPDCTPVWQSW